MIRSSSTLRRLAGLLAAATEPAYYPSCTQVDVPVSALAGWAPCYQETYASSGRPVASIVASCDKPYLMLAALRLCWRTAGW